MGLVGKGGVIRGSGGSSHDQTPVSYCDDYQNA